ncbi:MAG: HYR domain-containing protein, partial [Armatimonadota bacterium]|nr:HYR domain-containing protein [Armatimonadota bacterium]
CNPSSAAIDAALGTATASDNCGDVRPIPSDGTVSEDGCGRSQTRTWNVTDACGNAATPVSRTVTWTADTTPPVITCPANIVRRVIGEPCSAEIQFKATATDNCGGPVTIVYRRDAIDGPEVHSGDTFSGSTTVYAIATDECGNSSSCQFTIEVVCIPSGGIYGVKFRDLNMNGSFDVGEPPIAGFRIQVHWTIFDLSGDVTTITEADGSWSALVPVGAAFTAREVRPAGWIQTGPIPGSTNPGGEAVATAEKSWQGIDDLDGVYGLNFYNICVTQPSGGYTLGFWSNKNGQAVLAANDIPCRTAADVTYDTWRTRLSSLCLRRANGTDYNVPFPALPISGTICTPRFSAAYSGFRSWILNATATNMAYMLSAQLAATELDVWYKGLNSNAILVLPPALSACIYSGSGVPGPYTINQIVGWASAALCADGYTPSGDPNRAYQECLKTALDGINNNRWPFQSTEPCDPIYPPSP